MRRTTIVLATVLLALTAFVATLGLWVRADVADEAAFVEAALVSFQAEGSDDALGELIAAKVVEGFPSLLIFQGGLETLFSLLITTDPFLPMRVDVSEQIHRVALDGESAPVVVDLAEYREEVLTSVAAISPELADRIPDGAFRTFVIFEEGDLTDSSTPVTVSVILGWLSLILALAIVGWLVLAVRDIPVSFAAIGVALVVAAVALLLFSVLGGDYVSDTASNASYAVLRRNLFDVLIEPLRWRALMIGGIGVVMIAVAVTVRLVGRRRVAGQV